MNQEQLDRAVELKQLIKVTEEELNKFRDIRVKNPKEHHEGKYYSDGLYNLCISQQSDGSGVSARLGRHFGNRVIIEFVIKTLEEQLEYFKSEFKNL